jgi:hypothetical protein
MATAQHYRDRAKEARVKAENGNLKSCRLWLETAQALEKLAGDLPGKHWHTEKVGRRSRRAAAALNPP